jgi:hypothetical protein
MRNGYEILAGKHEGEKPRIKRQDSFEFLYETFVGSCEQGKEFSGSVKDFSTMPGQSEDVST